MTSLVAVIPGCLAAFTAYLAYKAGKENAEAIRATNRTVVGVAEKVELVHIATNSMKDQLVEATDQAAFARGKDDANAANAAALDARSVAHAEGRAEEVAARAAREPQSVPPGEELR